MKARSLLIRALRLAHNAVDLHELSHRMAMHTTAEHDQHRLQTILQEASDLAADITAKLKEFS